MTESVRDGAPGVQSLPTLISELAARDAWNDHVARALALFSDHPEQVVIDQFRRWRNP